MLNTLEQFEFYRALKKFPTEVLNDMLYFEFVYNIIYNTAIKIIETTGKDRSGPDKPGGGGKWTTLRGSGQHHRTCRTVSP